jgi:septum formation protein
MTVLLASGSPRRRDLLSRLAIEFEVCPSLVDERPPLPDEDPVAYVTWLARAKSADVARRRPGFTVLAADTEVVLDGRILGKPRDWEHANRMLESLAGRIHTVVTGVCVMCGGAIFEHPDVALVRMRAYSKEEITRYVDSGEPMGKAGGYALQGLGGKLVDSVDGCHDTVVGLPLRVARDLLVRCGVQPGVS